MSPRRAFALLFTFVLGAAAWAGPAVDVLVVGADDELSPLEARLEGGKVWQSGAWSFREGRLAGRTVVLAATADDPLNATAAAVLAIRHYHPRLVIALGAARALTPELQPGDLVVASGFAAFDGMESPVMPPGAGSDADKWTILPHLLLTAGGKEAPFPQFSADPAAQAVVRALVPARGRVRVGVLGSAGQVNREADRRAWIHRNWGALSEDSSSAFVAGCAQLLAVPMASWRVVDGRPGEAAALLPAFLEHWP